MDQKLKDAIFRQVEQEPFAKALKMELVQLEDGFSAVEMAYDADVMNNMFGRAHGGVSFPLSTRPSRPFARPSAASR
ncbi:hypothetical protein KOM00_10490 [Geomonas sp. Red69]|uniref:hypothetical protein n=1 Tax=Geomonas diazotrophica TaxID=2843197 RepID=UPI001C0FF27D|nr:MULTISPECIES: hypothetical protein [Geomonas]MBU5637161.1 hypothetical protein [Geomonas diazotrophica]QXE88632.1 hypothetical protein KP003_09630 [Geomonas nitrogeniifigens]